MGRNRTTKRDERLPPYVYRKVRSDLVEYQPYLGKGKFGKPIYLRDENDKTLHFNASVNEITKAYHRVINMTPAERTLGWLLDEYMKSPACAKLASSTRKHYIGYVDRIKQYPLKGGSTFFGQAALTALSRPILARYRDSLSASPITANRHLQFLSAVFSWGLELGYMQENAAQGVKKNAQPPRDNYVLDRDYGLALSFAPDWLHAAMEIAYLCRARRGEVLGMPVTAVIDEGLLIKRSKGSKSEIIRWSTRLRAAVDRAKAHNRTTISPLLIHTEFGRQVSAPAFNSAWARLMGKVVKAGGQKFPFHDLKARGYSEAPEQGAGHRSAKMHDVYMRLPEKRDATK